MEELVQHATIRRQHTLCALEEVEELEEEEEEEEEEGMEVAPSLVKFLYRLSTYFFRSAAVATSPVG